MDVIVFDVSQAPAGNLKVSFPYNPLAVSLIRQVEGRRFLRTEKLWLIPSYGLRDFQSRAAKAGMKVSISGDVRDALERGEQAKRQMAAVRERDDVPLNLPTQTVPYGFQRVGIEFSVRALKGFHGLLICDEMGLGKSFEALSVVALRPDFQNVLVLCPATLKYNWAAEIEKHYPEMSYVVVDGPAVERRGQWGREARIKIANYELLLRDPEPRLEDWDLVICDEVTFIKSYKAQRTKLVKKLHRKHSLGLSGTPLENRLEELHSIMDFAMPGLLGPGWLFVRQHVVKNYFGATIGYKALDKVRERIRPYYIRRLKRDVLTDLPEKVYNDYWLEMANDQWRVYEIIRRQIKEAILENPKLQVSNILTEMLRLKQVADAPALVEADASSIKLQALKDILEASEGHKIVAFTQFAQFARLIQQGVRCPIIAGNVPVVERQRIIQQFQDDGASLLVSTEAGAYGVNLTAADIIVHLDQPWNPARLRQREDRLHRIGQRRSVQVISFIARRTIDEYVRKIIFKKRVLAQVVFDEEDTGEGVAAQITRGDLLALLGEEE